MGVKRVLTLLVVLLGLFAPSLAVGEEVNPDNLIYTRAGSKDGFLHKKFTTEPLTGKVVGQIQGTLRKGKWHGPYAKFHDNGRLEIKGTNKDGEMEGPWVFFNEDGTKNTAISGTYRNGKKVSD